MPDLKLDSPLQYIKGVGPRKAEVLSDHGLTTVRDLLFYFPRQYLDRTSVTPIAEARIDQSVTVIGEIKAHGALYGGRRRYEAILQDDSGAIALLFFRGVKYWEKSFKKGQRFAATGVVSHFQGAQMIHPELERLDDGDSLIHSGRIVPVYPQTEKLSKVGLSSRSIRRLTSVIFENLKEKLTDPVPTDVTAPMDLLGLHDAVWGAHYPTDIDSVEKCRRRLAFDELLRLQFFAYRHKGKREQITKPHTYAAPGERLTKFKSNLPYKLTSAQVKVIKELIENMSQPTPMARLLQGDVGCGKTVVAMLAALYATENNLQCSFMAPTEILTEQHYRNWSGPLQAVGVKSALLTASLKKAAKEKIADQCASGDIDIIFGTHALIYDYVKFARLGLVIIDEQHRFGVDQRGKLHAKGDHPDLLAMTATPIPRTLALTLYGDLDISTIDSLPPGRKPVHTVWRDKKAREKVFQFVVNEAAKGGQTYIIYPLIEKSEQMELENVEEAYLSLTEGPLKELKVGMVHGRLKAPERDQVLKRFRDGELDVLLATTVIEVGMDNPNATILIIEHAERFGLAQLHQLRGRVGRGEKQATAIGLVHPPVSDIARERLKFFVGCADGFRIAEADLQLRGPGEMFGARQSGQPELQLANAWSDRDLLEAARDLLEKMFHSELEESSPLIRLKKSLEFSLGEPHVHLGGG